VALPEVVFLIVTEIDGRLLPSDLVTLPLILTCAQQRTDANWSNKTKEKVFHFLCLSHSRFFIMQFLNEAIVVL
jgi:hypothetical protein